MTGARTEPPILRVSGLSASYRTREGTVEAVRNVSFDLHRGEVLALVGESGAGKTSVALAMLQLLPGNAEVTGEVVYDGASLLHMEKRELRRIRGDEIAIIFQDARTSLNPMLKIGPQVAELLREHRRLSGREANEAVLRTLAPVLPDAERVVESYPFQLSGGMAQRVLIAMATALDPSVIIADEPTTSLDPGVRQEMLAWLNRLREEREIALLLITHDLGVVSWIADRVDVMYAGEIVESTDVHALFRTPKHPYTFGMLSSVPSLVSDGVRLRPMPGQPPDLSALPPHCPFLPRCNKAVSRCRDGPAPPLDEIEPGHRVACYNPMAVPLVLQER